MRFLKGFAKKGAYHLLHPLLRAYRKLLKPGSSGARAIVLHEGEVLLVRNIGVSYWSLPGGVQKPGETPLQCLVRELGEEIGVSVGSKQYRHKLGVYENDTGERVDTVHIYVVEVPSLRYRKDWELDEARWFKLEDLPEYLSPATRARLVEFRKGERNLRGQW